SSSSPESGTSLTSPPDPESILSGQALGAMGGGMSGGGMDPISEIALQYAFPILRPQIEEQVRRATVTVRWHGGEPERSFGVVQYRVAEQPPAALQQAAADAAGQAIGTALGVPQTGAAGAAGAGGAAAGAGSAGQRTGL